MHLRIWYFFVFDVCVYKFQSAPGGSGLIIQLETAAGAAMKNMCVCMRARACVCVCDVCCLTQAFHCPCDKQAEAASNHFLNVYVTPRSYK